MLLTYVFISVYTLLVNTILYLIKRLPEGVVVLSVRCAGHGAMDGMGEIA